MLLPTPRRPDLRRAPTETWTPFKALPLSDFGFLQWIASRRSGLRSHDRTQRKSYLRFVGFVTTFTNDWLLVHETQVSFRIAAYRRFGNLRAWRRRWALFYARQQAVTHVKNPAGRPTGFFDFVGVSLALTRAHPLRAAGVAAAAEAADR